MSFLMSRLRAFESLIDSIGYSYRGLDLTAKTHRWIFGYRLWHGAYPSNAEIYEARSKM
jgi:hypothetical protein